MKQFKDYIYEMKLTNIIFFCILVYRAHRLGVFQTESNRIEFQYLRNCGSERIKHKMNFVLPTHRHHTQVLVALPILQGGSYLGLKFYRIGKIWLFDEP